MNTRTNRLLMAALAVAALATGACDPYVAENKSPPAVVRALAYDRYGDPPFVTNTADADGGFTIPTIIRDVATGDYLGVPTAASATEPARWAGVALVLQFNKPMDPLSIQSQPTQNPDGTSNVNACVPAAGITITPPAEAGVTRWLTCYNPGQPDSSAGAEMIIAKVAATNGTDPRSSRLPANTVVTVTGTVRDQQGNSLPIKLTAHIDPLPAAP